MNLLYILCSLSFIFSACNTDNLGSIESIDDDIVYSELQLDVPGGYDLPFQTRLGVPSDDRIKSFKALVFEAEGKQKFLYEAEVTSNSINKYRVRLKKTRGSERVYIAAAINCDTISVLKDIPENIEYAELIKSTNFDALKTGVTLESTDLLPMWGISSKLSISNSTPLINIKLLRSIAKLKVVYSGDVRTFSPTTVTITSVPVRARIGYPFDDMGTPLLPYVGDGVRYRFKNYKFVNNETIDLPITELRSNQSPIYIFVEGKFKGDAENTYYKIPFDREVRRNHSYVINITDVLGSGGNFDTDKGSDIDKIKYDLMTWDPNIVQSFYSAGKYFGLDLTTFYFSGNRFPQDQDIKVQTNLSRKDVEFKWDSAGMNIADGENYSYYYYSTQNLIRITKKKAGNAREKLTMFYRGRKMLAIEVY